MAGSKTTSDPPGGFCPRAGNSQGIAGMPAGGAASVPNILRMLSKDCVLSSHGRTSEVRCPPGFCQVIRGSGENILGAVAFSPSHRNSQRMGNNLFLFVSAIAEWSVAASLTGCFGGAALSLGMDIPNFARASDMVSPTQYPGGLLGMSRGGETRISKEERNPDRVSASHAKDARTSRVVPFSHVCCAVRLM